MDVGQSGSSVVVWALPYKDIRNGVMMIVELCALIVYTPLFWFHGGQCHSDASFLVDSGCHSALFRLFPPFSKTPL